MTGIPVFNVNNNCSTGSTALFLARQAVASGAADCVLALGFEQMSPGALGAVFNDRPSPFDRFDAMTEELVGHGRIPAGAALVRRRRASRTCRKYGTQIETFAKVRAKASRHAANNPLALFRKEVTVEDVLASPDDLARRDDAADGVPADLRRGGRGDRARTRSPAATALRTDVRDRARRP